jgi:D-hydroxyproline dehydrogenase subunit beta
MPGIDVAVVGAGIVGLAHAWSAAKRGLSVAVFDRSPQAQGASIRNFGMVWPIGQTAGFCHETALASRTLWLEFAKQSGAWVDECGSIHLAYRPDEWAVLEEFAQRAPALGYKVRLLDRDAALEHSPAANPRGLLGGLYSSTELCVDPREALPALAAWLQEMHAVKIQFNSVVRSADGKTIETADGKRIEAGRTLVCGGADFETLFPDVFATSGLRRCKLQMLRTRTQADGWRIGPHVASGLTLRHYRNFEICESLAPLKQRVRAEMPELDRYGIHVMASQNRAGEVILGDSHEYDGEITPFDKVRIDELILQELRPLIRLKDWTIAERWSGIYAKHSADPQFTAEQVPGVQIVTATGGAGMTMSFGLAEANWRRWTGDTQ